MLIDKKAEHIKSYLDLKGHVFIVFDNKYNNVQIPSYLKDRSQSTKLRLSINYKFLPEFLSDKIIANLTFGGEYYECVIPYDAIIYVGAASYDEDLENSKFYTINYKKQSTIYSAIAAECEEDYDE